MFKKNFLILSFVFVFFLQPTTIHAVTNNSSSVTINSNSSSTTIQNLDNTPTTGSVLGTTTAVKSFWDMIMDVINSIINAIRGIFIKTEIDSSPEETNQFVNDYTRSDKDSTFRSLPASAKKYLIGVWFNDVINRPSDYENKVLNESTGNCPEIKVTDLVYFFYTKEQKILYKISDSSKPIDYDSSIIDKYQVGLNYPESCFQNTYDNIQTVPKGRFKNKEEAALMSTQLNQIWRLATSDKSHGVDAPDDNNTPEKAKDLSKDNTKQEKTMLYSFIPDDGKNNIHCTGDEEEDRQKVRDAFAKWLIPLSWRGNQNDGDDNTTPSRTDSDGENASNCTQSGHGQGMSQYGAYGMALSGYSYQDILYSYYRDTFMVTLSTIDTSHSNIVVALVNDDLNDSCVELATKYPNRFKYTKSNFVTSSGTKVDTFTLNIEDYLKGLGEMPLYWHVEAHKAQSVAARTYALNRTNNLSKPIRNTSSDQVFRCKKLLSGIETPNNQTQAVDETKGEVLLKNGKVFSTSYSSCHGQASLTPPYFDGTAFERLAKAPIKSQNGVCTVSSLTTNVSGSESSSTSGFFIFNGAKHESRISERYDIGSIDGGQWLKTYSGSCKLDSRVFTALDQLMAGAQSAGIDIRLLSCYRSIAEQQVLWEKTLAKYNGNEQEARKWTAKPGTSAHHTGRAIDFGDPTKSKAGSKLYNWLLTNGAKYGFYNYQPEPWHWEYNP